MNRFFLILLLYNGNEIRKIAGPAPKLFDKVRKSQKILAKWLVSGSKLSDREALLELLNILDDNKLIEQMREIEDPQTKENHDSEE